MERHCVDWASPVEWQAINLGEPEEQHHEKEGKACRAQVAAHEVLVHPEGILREHAEANCEDQSSHGDDQKLPGPPLR